MSLRAPPGRFYTLKDRVALVLVLSSLAVNIIWTLNEPSPEPLINLLTSLALLLTELG